MDRAFGFERIQSLYEFTLEKNLEAEGQKTLYEGLEDMIAASWQQLKKLTLKREQDKK